MRLWVIFFAILFSIQVNAYAISISSCSVLDQPGEYYLTQDIIDSSNTVCMNITANDVILDCQGYRIDGVDTSGSYGVYVYRNTETNTNVTIKNCVVSDWDINIYIGNSNNITVENVTVSSGSLDGFFVVNSTNNTFKSITSVGNNYNEFYNMNYTILDGWHVFNHTPDGIYMESSNYNTITNSVIENNTGSGFGCYRCNNNIFENLTLFNNSQYGGISLMNSTQNIFLNITAKENDGGDINILPSAESDCDNYFENVIISGAGTFGYYNYSVNIENMVFGSLILCNADFSNITNITIIDSETKNNGGIGLYFTDNSTIKNANLSYVGGMHLWDSNYNTINGLQSKNSSVGIVIDRSIYNTIKNSRVENSLNYGIGVFFNDQGPNIIYNNFFNNSVNVYLLLRPYTNLWNTTKQSGVNIVNGPYLGGNFYAFPNGTGFSETCSDSDKDGICDSSYTLATNNIDYLPLAVYTSYPTNVSVDTSDDGVIDFLHPGELNSTVKVDLNVTAIRNYLSACTPDADGYCLVPINVTSATRGKIVLDSLEVSYSFRRYKITTVVYNPSFVNLENITLIAMKGEYTDVYTFPYAVERNEYLTVTRFYPYAVDKIRISAVNCPVYVEKTLVC